jgi:hypothetical protein
MPLPAGRRKVSQSSGDGFQARKIQLKSKRIEFRSRIPLSVAVQNLALLCVSFFLNRPSSSIRLLLGSGRESRSRFRQMWHLSCTKREIAFFMKENLMSHQQHQPCIQACIECAQECNHCADACLGDRPHCARLCIDCAEMCWACPAYMSRGSRFMEEVCRVCADICDACATECGKHSNDHCQRCAEACRHCAEECRHMAGVAA